MPRCHILDAHYYPDYQPAEYRHWGVLLTYEGHSPHEWSGVDRQIHAALQGPPLTILSEHKPDGTWWVREGIDLSGVFENWNEELERAGTQTAPRQLRLWEAA